MDLPYINFVGSFFDWLGELGPIDLGSLPDWVEAVGTSGALIYIGIQHHRDRTKDREQRQKDTEQRKEADDARLHTQMAQARLISVTCEWELSDRFSILLKVANDSEKLIRDLKIYVLGKEVETVAELDHNKTKIAEADKLLPGKATRLRAFPVYDLPFPRNAEERDLQIKQLDNRFEIGMEFTDASGLRWLWRRNKPLSRMIDLGRL